MKAESFRAFLSLLCEGQTLDLSFPKNNLSGVKWKQVHSEASLLKSQYSCSKLSQTTREMGISLSQKTLLVIWKTMEPTKIWPLGIAATAIKNNDSFRLENFFQYPWKNTLPLFRWSSCSDGCYTCYQRPEKLWCLGSPMEPQQAGGDSKTHSCPERQSRIRTLNLCLVLRLLTVFRNLEAYERFTGVGGCSIREHRCFYSQYAKQQHNLSIKGRADYRHLPGASCSKRTERKG